MASADRPGARRSAPTGPAAKGRQAAKGRPPARGLQAAKEPGSRPQTRTERRRAAKARRARLVLAGSVVLAVLVVAAWFPASALYHQHQQLATSSGQLAQLRQQDHALQREYRRLGSSSEVARIARQQYQLVEPGQQAYEVLPPAGTAAGSSYDGDPGLQGAVTPTGASELPPGSVRSSSSETSASHGSTTASSSSGSAPGTSSAGAPDGTSSPPSVVGRIVQTLEFWH